MTNTRLTTGIGQKEKRQVSWKLNPATMGGREKAVRTVMNAELVQGS